MLFTSELSLVLIAPIRGGMARLSWPGWLVKYNAIRTLFEPAKVTHASILTTSQGTVSTLIATNGLPLSQTTITTLRNVIKLYKKYFRDIGARPIGSLAMSGETRCPIEFLRAIPISYPFASVFQPLRQLSSIDARVWLRLIGMLISRIDKSSLHEKWFDMLCYVMLCMYVAYVCTVSVYMLRDGLRSSSTDQLIVPSHRLSTVGVRAFPIAGAYIWNGLPANVTSAPSLPVLRQRLKTVLFHRSYPNICVIWTLFFPLWQWS